MTAPRIPSGKQARRPSAIRHCLVVALAALGGIHCACAVTYSTVDLGTLPGSGSSASSAAFAVNNAGQVVGESNSSVGPANTVHAFLYSGGVMTDLGALTTAPSRGLGVSDSGLVTGYSYLGSSANHAFLYDGTLHDLGSITSTSGPNSDVSQGYDVNDSGEVVGFSYTASGNTHAFISSGGVLTDLGALGGTFSTAFAINNAGQAVGYYAYNKSGGGTGYRAFLYSGGVMSDLGLSINPGSDADSRAFAINDAGQITGWAHIGGNGAQAFIYSSGGAITSLGSLVPGNPGNASSAGYAINNVGQVFGVSEIGGGAQHYFLSTGGVMLDLTNAIVPSAGITNIRIPTPENPNGNPGNASVLNDWGQLAAVGRIDGHDHALLLNPDTPFTTASAGSQTAMVVGGIGYDLVPAVTNPGGLGTTAQLLGGTAGANQQVVLTFTGGGNFGGEASDTLSLSGTGASPFVLQLTYDEALAQSLPGGELGVSLLWLDPADSTWKNAVLGNSDAAVTGLTGFQGDGAYDPATDFVLGYYGVDTATNRVWAVLDHNSTFGAGDVSAVPEPAAWGELLSASCLLAAALRRRPAKR